MAKVKKQPTDRELDILRILWARGSSTVRQVNDSMTDTGYTTTLKLMQIMAEKGLLNRDQSQRTHIYSAAEAQESTQSQMVGNLVEKAFGGSTKNLVMQALESKKAPAAELAKIKEMLEKIEGE